MIRSAIWTTSTTACCSSYNHSSEHSQWRHQTFQKVYSERSKSRSHWDPTVLAFSLNLLHIGADLGLTLLQFLPLLGKQLALCWGAPSIPPLKPVLIEHSVFLLLPETRRLLLPAHSLSSAGLLAAVAHAYNRNKPSTSSCKVLSITWLTPVIDVTSEVLRWASSVLDWSYVNYRSKCPKDPQ